MKNNSQNSIPQWVFECAVKDCKNVEEFAQKYRWPERFAGRGTEYVNVIMKSHYEDIEERGYTTISRHDNVTGMLITFIPSLPPGAEAAGKPPKIKMGKNYVFVYAALDAEYSAFASRIETAIRLAAARLLKQSRKKSLRVNLQAEEIRLGEYEPLISGYQAIDSMLLRKGEILIRLELEKTYKSLNDHHKISLYDKLSILNALESKITPSE